MNNQVTPRVTTRTTIKLDELVGELVRQLKADNIPFDDTLPALLLEAMEHNESLGDLFTRQAVGSMYDSPVFQALHRTNCCLARSPWMLFGRPLAQHVHAIWLSMPRAKTSGKPPRHNDTRVARPFGHIQSVRKV